MWATSPRRTRAAVGIGAQKHVGELLGALEAAARGDGRIESLAGHRRAAAKLAGGHLGVLRGERRADVGDGDAVVGHLIGVEPEAHRILAAEDDRLADARNPADRLLEIRVDEVQNVVARQGLRFGIERINDQEVADRFLHLHAQTLHLRRQQRDRELELVLHLDLGDVRIGSRAERDCDGDVAVGIARGLHVEHVVNAGEILLDDLGDGVLDGIGGGSRVGGGDRHLGRGDIGILRDGERTNGKEARTYEEEGEHPGKHWTVDEKSGHGKGVGRVACGEPRVG